MSRGFTFGILAVLLVLLGVMSFAVRSATQPDKPSPEEEAKMQQQQQQQQQKDRMKQEVAERKKMMQMREESMKKLKKNPAKSAPMSMDISSDWFKKREPGETGIEKISKAAAEADKPAAVPAAASSSPESAAGKTPAVNH